MAAQAVSPTASLDEQIRRMTPVVAPAAARAKLIELAKVLGPAPLVAPGFVEVVRQHISAHG